MWSRTLPPIFDVHIFIKVQAGGIRFPTVLGIGVPVCSVLLILSVATRVSVTHVVHAAVRLGLPHMLELCRRAAANGGRTARFKANDGTHKTGPR